MSDKVSRAERARMDRAQQQSKDRVTPKPKNSEFEQALKKSQMSLKTSIKPEPTSKETAEYAIRHAVKRHEDHGESKKRDERDKDEGRDSHQDGSSTTNNSSGQKVIAKGRLKGQGGGAGGRGNSGGFDLSGEKRSLAKALKKSGVKNIPLDLRIKFAKRLGQKTKIDSTADAMRMSQEVLDKMVQYVRMGVNTKGEKEIQIELNERMLRGLKLRVIARGGRVTVMFKTNDAAGIKALEYNKNKLKKSLEEKGIEVEEILVS